MSDPQNPVPPTSPEGDNSNTPPQNQPPQTPPQQAPQTPPAQQPQQGSYDHYQQQDVVTHHPGASQAYAAPVTNPNEPPTFLKVLCILTFVGSGLGLLYYAYQWVTVGASLEMYEAMGLMTDNLDNLFSDTGNESFGGLMGGFMRGPMEYAISMYQNAYWWFPLMMLTCLGTLGGGLLMYKRQKKGFYIYTAASFIQIIGPLLLAMNSTAFGVMFMMLIINAAFVIMYGVNLKHMR